MRKRRFTSFRSLEGGESDSVPGIAERTRGKVPEADLDSIDAAEAEEEEETPGSSTPCVSWALHPTMHAHCSTCAAPTLRTCPPGSHMPCFSSGHGTLRKPTVSRQGSHLGEEVLVTDLERAWHVSGLDLAHRGQGMIP